MALLHQFFYRENAGTQASSYALARDVTNDRVFVIHSWAEGTGPSSTENEKEIELGEFLQALGPAQHELLQLIGSLVTEA